MRSVILSLFVGSFSLIRGDITILRRGFVLVHNVN